MSGNEGSALRAAPSTRYQSLDVWRGIACLLIVGSHACLEITNADWEAAHGTIAGRLLFALSAYGYIGVPLFFVISGYCIAATAESSRRRGAPPAEYFRRRLRRIVPPYWIICAIALGLVVLLSAAGAGRLLTTTSDRIPHPRELDAWQWIGNLTLSEIFRPHLVGGPTLLVFGPSWTLCYEEQFYTLCGLLLWLAPRRFFPALSLVSLAVAVVCACSLRWNYPLVGFFFDGRWLIFASGLLVYHVVNRAGPRARTALVAGLGAAALLGLGLRYGVLARSANREGKLLLFEIVFGALFGLLLIALHRHDAAVARSRLLAPLRYCGAMCYSLYLVHWPVTLLVTHGLDLLGIEGVRAVFAVTLPMSLALSIGLARLFHLHVERRFLNPPADAASARA